MGAVEGMETPKPGDDEIISRLDAYGASPVDAPVASAHLTAIGAAATGGRGRARRLRVGAAFLAGLLLGGTGLASAGALPGVVQAAAHDALGSVGVDVPDRERSTEGCEGEEYRNHGDFVSSQAGDGDNSDAAKSDCGKPIRPASAEGQDDDGPGSDHASECRPPWAGGGLTADERDVAKATWERPDTCAEDADDEGEDADDEGEGDARGPSDVPADPGEPGNGADPAVEVTPADPGEPGDGADPAVPVAPPDFASD